MCKKKRYTAKQVTCTINTLAEVIRQAGEILVRQTTVHVYEQLKQISENDNEYDK